ncbi:hypothetical protein KPH14_010329 [Odynerus spinipes]|uniref:Uncharacterized protein n=1 Tax=Odynerus spinipes TaxID=1348599 RepID=A0AAD9RTT1_9HYME|nr:hypothetical protein KPH14_010329 [Odynerus spinipes]
MNYQAQISTITGTAPPSYTEAMSQQPPSKDSFPVAPPMPQPYGTHVQPPPTASTNYQEYNTVQPPYNPMYLPTTQSQTRPTAIPCVVTTTAYVGRKRRNHLCSSCLKMLIFAIVIVCLVIYLLKVIISSILN